MRGPKAAQFESQLADLEREWQNIQTNLERSAGLEADIESLETGLKEIQGRLMKAEDVALNSEFFYNLERETGVEFQGFAQVQATNGEGLNMPVQELRHFSVIPYDISLLGDLESILAFIDTLDRQNFIIRMDNLDLSRSQDLTADPNLLIGRIRCNVLAQKHE